MSENELGTFDMPELVIGLVGPIGVDMDTVQQCISEALKQVDYSAEIIHISKLVECHQAYQPQHGHKTKLGQKIADANAFCEQAGDGAALAALAVTEIIRIRKAIKRQRKISSEENSGIPSQAYIIRQLKRFDEIAFLRSVYGEQFIQVSISLDKEARVKRLSERLSKDHPGLSEADCEVEARLLIEVDENEYDKVTGKEKRYGQQLEKIFHTADFFVGTRVENQIGLKVTRFVRALFGDNKISPNKDEVGAYIASAAALRSADVSRQVGSAIFSSDGDVIAMGCNEVPKAGGGNYWFEDEAKARDIDKGSEQNTIEKNRIILDFVERLRRAEIIPASVDFESSELRDKLTSVSDDALISDITEYGRMTHAEMSAICDAARLGRSIRGATMFVTTFPCHNCAKHIIACGISRVVYIEPYPKSRAERSHHDSIIMDEQLPNRVSFEHFEGISPSRYREFFRKSKRRQKNGTILAWVEGRPRPIVTPKERHVIIEAVLVAGVLKRLLPEHDDGGLESTTDSLTSPPASPPHP